MRLSTKLFLFVSVVVLIICLGIYFVPSYIISRHTAEDRRRFEQELIKERAVDQQHYMTWLRDEFAATEGAVDAFLFLVAGHDRIQQGLLPGQQITPNVWLAGARLMSYSDRIDFLQINQGREKSAAITLSRSRLFVSKRDPIGQGLAWVETSQLSSPQNKKILLGVWLPEPGDHFIEEVSADDAHVPQIYLLLDPLALLQGKDRYTQKLKEVEKELAVNGHATVVREQVLVALLTRLAKAESYLQTTFDSGTPKGVEALKKRLHQFDPDFPPGGRGERFPPYLQEYYREAAKKSTFTASDLHPIGSSPMPTDVTEESVFFSQFLMEVRRINELEMMNALAFLASLGEEYTSPFASGAPVGAARIIPSLGLGTAVFSAEAFSAEELFDAQSHFARYPPLTKRFPIASDFELIGATKVGAVTLANVIEMVPEQQVYLALGASLYPIVHGLAQVSGETTLMLYDDEVVVQLGPSLEQDRTVVARQLLENLPVQNPYGFIDLGDTRYFYSSYVLDPDWTLQFITLVPARVVLAPIQEFEARSRDLTRQVSRHLIGLAIGVFIVALIILEILTRHFTRPIRHLAAATEQVAEGKYEKINLPEVHARSRNEISVLTRSFKQMVKGLTEREALRSVLDKVVSKEIADEILQGRVHLGGETKVITVLFADIRNFTGLTEKLPPAEVIQFVNSYWNLVTETIEAHQGVIDKYIGDEVMALYGAPVGHEYSPLQAIVSALEIRRRLAEWNIEREEQGLFTVTTGFGIHTGPMLAGNMGAEDRLNYTVVGANVNLAARLCQEAAPMEILLVEGSTEIPQVREAIQVEYRSDELFKGFSEAKRVYRVIGLKEEAVRDHLLEKMHLFGPNLLSDSEK